ncbi:MAG TPA: nuclear transport factor 2 family protein [Pseudolabrys sp.]|nr:nuclear transport factor 2 family protein [Pseudolabrys sp.]
MRSVADRLAIAEIMQNWVLWRDARDWERFRTLWHKDGRMMATWFQGSADDFIKVSAEGYAQGARIVHMLGATSVDIKGKRAIAQSKTVISQRAPVEGVLCDVNCAGRFYTFLEKRNRRWGIVLLQPIYEKDRLDPVDPSAALKLDATLLARFPEGYRHLAYLQTRLGYNVKRDMPGLDGPALDALYAQGKRWLQGKRL